VELIGTNAKMSEIHAAIGLYSLKHFEEAVKKRKKICDTYKEALSSLNEVSFLPRRTDVEDNFQYFPVFFKSERIRDGLYNELRNSFIFARKYFFPPIHLLKPYRHQQYRLPITEDFSSRVLCLPLHSEMSKEQAIFVVEKITNYLKTTIM